MFLGTLGKRENADGKGTCALESAERPIVKRQAAVVIVKSIAIAIVVAAVVFALPI